MELRPSARALVGLGAVLLLIAAGAGLWELLASQSPHSPYHLGVLAAPVGQLRATAATLGLAALAGAWLLPWLAPDREPWLLVGLIGGGALLTVVALAVGASRGLMVIHIEDPRADARLLFGARAVGYVLLVSALLDVVRRTIGALRR